MPKAYWVATYRSISSPDAVAAYGQLAAPAIIAAGGRILARGIPAATLEAGLKQRTVLIEFDSLDAALAAYASPDYKAALKLLGTGAAERDIRIIEAL